MRLSDFKELLARQVEQVLRRHCDTGAVGLDNLHRRVRMSRRVIDILVVDLQVIIRRRAVSASEGSSGGRPVEKDSQDIVDCLLRRDQVLARNIAELLIARQVRLRVCENNLLDFTLRAIEFERLARSMLLGDCSHSVRTSTASSGQLTSRSHQS